MSATPIPPQTAMWVRPHQAPDVARAALKSYRSPRSYAATVVTQLHQVLFARISRLQSLPNFHLYLKAKLFALVKYGPCDPEWLCTVLCARIISLRCLTDSSLAQSAGLMACPSGS